LKAVALGYQAGNTNQGAGAIAIGNNAGQTGQFTDAVAMGYLAGQLDQSANAVAIGSNAGNLTQGQNAVAVGVNAGQTNQGTNAVAVGRLAGNTGQLGSAVAIGNAAGQTSQGLNTVAIGVLAGNSGQLGSSVALGNSAGQTSQSGSAVAIGRRAGTTSQGDSSVAIGYLAGTNTQGGSAIAIGVNAGRGTTSGQGANAIAIGNSAGIASQTAGSICLNASGLALNPANAGFYVNPIRNDATPVNICYYNTTTREVTYGGLINLIYPIGAIIQSSVSTNPGTYITGTTWVAYGAGQVLVGKATSGTFLTAGSTGGAETVTLIANNLPAHSHPNTLTDPLHSHSIQRSNQSATIVGTDTSAFYQPLVNSGTNYYNTQLASTGITITNANNVTTNAAVNILQPYIVVYTWTRTA
jgi:hypothetical protein